MAEQVIICIGCPMGCHVRVSVGEQGEVEILGGNECKRGEKYIIDEARLPVRVLTTTLLVEGNDGLLPVRTNRPIPKSALKDCMYTLARARVKPPVRLGQVLLPDVCGTGADLIASGELQAS